ncbi:MAG: hypothetical protein HDR46_01150 [Bacteroides sp.]|nr:hypothetical protein [Bacteroides sp.]
MTALENVKVGDKLYVSNRFFEDIEIVERITQTLVITKKHRFVKKSGRLYGSDSWNTIYARPATAQDELNIRDKQRRAELIHACKNINYEAFTTPQLESIISFMKELNEK